MRMYVGSQSAADTIKLNFIRCGPIRCRDLASGRPSLSSLRFRNAVQRIDSLCFRQIRERRVEL